MIIPQAPVEPPVNTNNVTEVQASEQLQRPDIHQIVREIFLRNLINGTVKRNERYGIQTGVAVTDLQSGHTIAGQNQDEVHFAASINKLPIALLVLEDLRAGTLDLDQTMTWQASDQRGGFGFYDQPGAPLEASLRDVLFDLLNRSGNTVTRVLVNGALGGAEAVNDRFAAKPQLSNTSLVPLGNGLFFLGDSTARDSLWAMTELLKTQDSYAAFMKDALATNIFTDFGVRSQLSNKDYVVLANKVGILNDISGNNRHDVGIIYNTKTGKSYGYSFFTTSPFESETATPQAEHSLQFMGRHLLHFAGTKKQHKDAAPDTQRSLQTPAQGRMIY
jgi:hypothetical protein